MKICLCKFTTKNLHKLDGKNSIFFDKNTYSSPACKFYAKKGNASLPMRKQKMRIKNSKLSLNFPFTVEFFPLAFYKESIAGLNQSSRLLLLPSFGSRNFFLANTRFNQTVFDTGKAKISSKYLVLPHTKYNSGLWQENILNLFISSIFIVLLGPIYT